MPSEVDDVRAWVSVAASAVGERSGGFDAVTGKGTIRKDEENSELVVRLCATILGDVKK